MAACRICSSLPRHDSSSALPPGRNESCRVQANSGYKVFDVRNGIQIPIEFNPVEEMPGNDRERNAHRKESQVSHYRFRIKEAKKDDQDWHRNNSSKLSETRP